jgi:hypothetical protein
MSMSHKAFAFNWYAFDFDLSPILLAALDADDGSELADIVNQERHRLTDPYNGDPLPEDWRTVLEVGDVQELADFALTLYYGVQEDHGVGSAWLTLNESLTAEQRLALLGGTIGVGDRLFDPGRLGSYFQSPEVIGESLKVLDGVAANEVQCFRELLAECAVWRLGVYVTF